VREREGEVKLIFDSNLFLSSSVTKVRTIFDTSQFSEIISSLLWLPDLPTSDFFLHASFSFQL
jgi:hypothetical protein